MTASATPAPARHPEERSDEGSRDGEPLMPSARSLPGTGSLAFARDDGENYGAGYTRGYLFSIPSSFITFSIASMSHGASFETTSAPLSVMKIMSSRRT
jgi:hypothetical protein